MIQLADIKVRYKVTSEKGLTPNGELPPENLLAWINHQIIEARISMDNSAHNGSHNDNAEGALMVLKELKEALFGNIYDT